MWMYDEMDVISLRHEFTAILIIRLLYDKSGQMICVI